MTRKRMLQILFVVLAAIMLGSFALMSVTAIAANISLKQMEEYTTEQETVTQHEEELYRINTSDEHFEKSVITEQEMSERQETETSETNHWRSLGQCRITEYCPSCNDPVGSYQSSSGKRLKEGYVACKWLPNGTRIRIDDTEYVVMDYCGTDAIDIFCDTEECHCDANYYTEVFVLE